MAVVSIARVEMPMHVVIPLVEYLTFVIVLQIFILHQKEGVLTAVKAITFVQFGN